MRGQRKQSGFSLVELMVGMTVLIIVFGGSFQVLTKIRTSSKAQDSSGPHLYFETFASARLRLYYSKLMQWIVHVGANDCSDASRYAYASNNPDLVAGNPTPSRAHGNRTLGADMRMALSTLSYEDVYRSAGVLTDRLNKNDVAWAALVPFSSRSLTPDAILNANEGLASFCDANAGLLDESQGVARELCAWVDTCSAQGGDRTPAIALKEDVTGGGVPYLSASLEDGTASIGGLNGQNTFRMCFALVGNLFSRSGNVVTAPPPPELEVVDNPSVLGLAVGTATFRNSNTGAPITCNEAVNEMYRSLSVRLHIYTVLNAENTVASKKQRVYKTVKEFSSEKIGAPVPNCSNTPSFDINLDTYANDTSKPMDAGVCLSAPSWFYQCSKTCAPPNKITVK